MLTMKSSSRSGLDVPLDYKVPLKKAYHAVLGTGISARPLLVLAQGEVVRDI
jgi:hypothetical protein